MNPELRDRPSATVIVVAYRNPVIDLEWIPADIELVVVENDDHLVELRTSCDVTRISFDNIGFGAAINQAAKLATGDRFVLCNPDLAASADHLAALLRAGEDEVATVPIVDLAGERTSVVNQFPTPASLVLTGFRIGRILPRGSRSRALLTRVLGRWGRAHGDLMAADVGVWPLREMWCSGALIALSADRFRAVGGFDERFFLYLEDVDLCARLADRFDSMSLRLAAAPPAVHAVSASSAGSRRRITDLHYARSAATYASDRTGVGWRAARAALAVRVSYLQARL